MIPRFWTQVQPGRPLRRRSERHPGLVLDLLPPYLAFRRGHAFEVFKLAGGEPELVACSPRGWGELAVFECVRDVAQAYAEALHGASKAAADGHITC